MKNEDLHLIRKNLLEICKDDYYYDQIADFYLDRNELKGGEYEYEI